MKNLTLTCLLLVFAATIVVFAQDDIRTSNGQRLPTTAEQASTRDFEGRLRAMNRLMNQRREASGVKVKRLSKEERKRFEDATTASKDDVLKYKDLLKESNTGIFRLIPNSDCQTDTLIKLDGECAGFVPDAWAYSFRLEDYSEKDFQDISYEDGNLVAGGLLNQGILVDLGEDPVEKIGLDHPGVSYLNEFVPAQDHAGADRQFAQLAAGIRSGDLYLSNSAPVGVGRTYAFRVIAYRYGDKWASRFRGRNFEKLSKEERKFGLIKFDSRIDSTYVFTVVRQAEDRGITIVWKRLSKAKSPKMVFKEDEKLEDFGIQ